VLPQIHQPEPQDHQLYCTRSCSGCWTKWRTRTGRRELALYSACSHALGSLHGSDALLQERHHLHLHWRTSDERMRSQAGCRKETEERVCCVGARWSATAR
jgi:hypothetical protein